MSFPRQIDGRYQILQELAVGSMGAVYKALDARLERTVAIKTIRLDTNRAEVGNFRLRFEREARSAGRLNHPNIVIVYDSGQSDDVAFISMEYLSGTTLESLISHGSQISLHDAIHIAGQIADALAYAHDQGVVHRDIKPANIMQLAGGQIKLTDFGISQLSNSDLTQSGVVLGTPKYMSPEQITGSRVDGRSDLFSLGVVLYEMLTGRVPFQAPSLVSMMHTVLHAQPEPPTHWAPSVPLSIVSILARCLAKLPEDRYGSAADLAADLKRFPDGAVDADAIRRVFFSDASFDLTACAINTEVVVCAPLRELEGEHASGVDLSLSVISRRVVPRWSAWASALTAGLLLAAFGGYAITQEESALARVNLTHVPNLPEKIQISSIKPPVVNRAIATKIKVTSVHARKVRIAGDPERNPSAQLALGATEDASHAELTVRPPGITRESVDAEARAAEAKGQIPRGESNILGN